jgi:hypothetical protein
MTWRVVSEREVLGSGGDGAIGWTPLYSPAARTALGTERVQRRGLPRSLVIDVARPLKAAAPHETERREGALRVELVHMVNGRSCVRSDRLHAIKRRRRWPWIGAL